MMIKVGYKIFILIVLVITLKLCYIKGGDDMLYSNLTNSKTLMQSALPYTIKIKNNIIINEYFNYLDSIVKKYDSLTPYKLTEHLLVRANPWIIDTLQNTDYYRMIAKDSFVYDQKKMIVLAKGTSLIIPDTATSKTILYEFQNTHIDINIPEYKLRVYQDSVKLYEFPIRVGRNEEKYLKMSGRIEDLKTKIGKGHIVNHVRNPRYVNPVNNHEYFNTKRDDDKITKVPQIPFIETEMNGLRYGQLIHPTTNPITLGKAYSNGCIGTREADAWVIYYHAPINTKIKIRYDLNVHDENEKKIVLKDIYKTKKNSL